jgi:type 1 glutamine amidotransferase
MAPDVAGGLTVDRRTFVGAGAAAGAIGLWPAMAQGQAAGSVAPGTRGWEWEPMRWVQICATEDDPGRYDRQFWQDFLRRTATQGVCLSAGGVTAFYPTQVPLHYRSPYLGDGDMLGELVEVAKSMDIRVLARVDPHATRADTLAAQPGWIARDAAGAPKRHPTDPELYLTCPNGPVTFEWMPQILQEIVTAYPVDGIFGNRWAGSAGICHCEVCRTKFHGASGGLAIPASLADVGDPAVRAYLVWDDSVRYEQLELWARTVSAASPQAFFTPGTWGRLDPRRLRQTARALFADRQARSGNAPAWLNGFSAKETACLMPDRPMSGIFAVGETGTPYRFMDSVQAPAEISAYLHNGLAHGFRPWMTKFKAEVFDKRWVPVVEKAYAWHARHERYFRNTDNLAEVAMLHSKQTDTYYVAGAAPEQTGGGGMGGPADAQSLRHGSDDAVNGFYQALVESRIPFNFVDERLLDPAGVDRYRVIVLPNIAALSDEQCAALRAYVERGGALVATHESALYDEWGKQRDNFGLADLFGCDFAGTVEQRVQNSYLTVRGPGPLTVGVDDTPRIMAGTRRVHVRPRAGALAGPAAFTLVPSYPDLPMEKVYPDTRETDEPMVFARQVGRGRVVYFPFDLDQTFWENSTGDHLALLRNAVLWAAGSDQPLTVSGPGMVDVAYWAQDGSVAAHLVNLNNPMAMRGYMREIIAAGPYTVSLVLPEGRRPARVRLLEAETEASFRQEGGRLIVEVPQIHLHEVVAVDLA